MDFRFVMVLVAIGWEPLHCVGYEAWRQAMNGAGPPVTLEFVRNAWL